MAEHFCTHGDRVLREGTSPKSGKPYRAWFCPQPRDSTDQCEPEWEEVKPVNEQILEEMKKQTALLEKMTKTENHF